MCCCCDQDVQEIIEHLFMSCPNSELMWKEFTAGAGLIGPFIQLGDTFNKWESTEMAYKLRPLFKAVPMFIV